MLQIILCDDDLRFLDSLCAETRRILDEYGLDAALHAFDNAQDIPAELLPAGDLFFLDVDFPGGNSYGIELARRIREQNLTAVIVFVSNYLEFAPEGYEVQAFRYLMKSELSEKLERCLLQSIQVLQTNRSTLEIHIGNQDFEIPLAEIRYITARNHASLLHLRQPDGATCRFQLSLNQLEETLTGQGFLRVHKSYLVNMRYIQRYQSGEVLLDDGTTLCASKRSYAMQKKRFLLWKRML